MGFEIAFSNGVNTSKVQTNVGSCGPHMWGLDVGIYGWVLRGPSGKPCARKHLAISVFSFTKLKT
ncbi:hypothetical protein [Acaryochloris marina]|uniref:hypothetical protein n=1 Tax=Acaryochloris marina TaxID=155978 RepID=UPI0021C43492|nr:hypothetical protein [Acaryochloris marina]BDM83730.1 hypothetical protein AM10699_65910 [Acaryochloris marina MBIC10699]